MPTSLTSAEIEQLDVQVRELGRFSARVRSVRHLATIDDGVNDILAGASDRATQRLAIKQFLKSTGHIAPEGKAGGLQDFASDARINLQLRMGVQMAQGYGEWKQGQDPDLLDAFPARELLRVEDREVPRDWIERWIAARAATTAEGATEPRESGGRMVAIVGHPIWVELSRFRQPYEPFDYGSGMGTEDVARREAVDLGIIGRDTQIFPQDRPFARDVQADVEVRSTKLRQLLEEEGTGHFNAQGVFVRGKKGGRA
jgi:hypothetical protein